MVVHDTTHKTEHIPVQHLTDWKSALESLLVLDHDNGRYLHHSGAVYVVTGMARDGDTGAPTVIYRGEDGQVWTRLHSSFAAPVRTKNGGSVPRLTYRGN